MKKSLIHIMMFSVFSLIGSNLLSQNINEILQYAEQLEMSGQLEEALSIYEELYQTSPNNETIFNQLRRIYLDTRAYEKAIGLIEEHQQVRPNDIALEIGLAQVYFRMGQEEEARKRWDLLLERYPTQTYVYQMVANGLIEERLYDDAVDVYQLGRERMENENLFIFDLAHLYGTMIEYGKAAEELIRYLILNPHDGNSIENQILRYPKTDRIINDIVKQFEKAIRAQPTHLELRRILVSVCLYAGRYTDGLLAVRELEMLTEEGKQGEALFRFGKEAFQSGETKIAEEAFLEILEVYAQFYAKDYVLFDLAQCYEAQNRFREAIDNYDKIYREYPQSPLALQVLYRKGLVQMTETADVFGAITTFQYIVDRFPSGRYRNEAQLALGSCMIDLGDLDQADKIFEEILKQSKESGGNLNIQALVRLAEVHYLRGEFEEVVSLLEDLKPEEIGTQAMQDPVLNDGLNLRLFVGEYFPNAPDPLALFAQAEFLERQRKYDQAIHMLDSLIISYPDMAIVADALFKEGEIYIQLEAFHESLNHFDALLSRFSKSLLADQSIEHMGWVYEKIGDSKKALEQYEILLADYPHSFFVDEVRQRIRRIEEAN